MTEAVTPPSLLGAARQLGQSALGLLQSRIALVGIELQEEKLRALSVLVWLGLALTLGAAGVLVAVGALALFAWNQAGFAGLGTLAASCLLVAAIIVARVRHGVRNAPSPFATTAEEFRKDLECLRRE
jgi:uncharacterized membrane protein YqjE